MHRIPRNEGGGRTELGELVYSAKPYDKTVTNQHKQAARNLALHLGKFLDAHPSYHRFDFLVPVPYYGRKEYDLPKFLVEQLCALFNKSNEHLLVQKVKSTKSMKNAQSEEEKFNIVQGAFEVTSDSLVRGKRVVVIDDIYQSGRTLHELASTLKRAGAEVLGLVATKTLLTVNQDLGR